MSGRRIRLLRLPGCSPRPSQIHTPQARFGQLLAGGIRETRAALTSAKSQLEAVVLDGGARDATLGVTLIHQMRQVGKIHPFTWQVASRLTLHSYTYI